jgi:pre-mRNA-splicing factor ISY1
MARNEEKANAMLNRWIEQQKMMEEGKGMFATKRPAIASECTVLKDAQKFRSQILREVSKKISEIQNAGLGEHRLRDLNDEINKLLREKGHWETQVKSLGGPDYAANAPKTFDAFGSELSTQSGYKYFGAAKDLPGVRELFEQQAAPEAPRKTRKDLFKHLQPDYYGWRDEEDALLLLQEQQMEQQIIALEEEALKKRGVDTEKAAEEREVKKQKVQEFKAYVSVPSSEEIEQLLLQKKKEMLLAKYATPEEVKRGEDAKALATAK